MIQILHIEDKPAHAELARLALSPIPIASFETSRSMRDALSLLRLVRHDLILIDLDLPDSVGLETVRTIRNERPDSVLIVLSNHEAEVMGTASIEAGADDFLPKSELVGDALPRAVRHALARRDRHTKRRLARA